MRHADANFSAGKRGTPMLRRRHVLWAVVIQAQSAGKQEEPT